MVPVPSLRAISKCCARCMGNFAVMETPWRRRECRLLHGQPTLRRNRRGGIVITSRFEENTYTAPGPFVDSLVLAAPLGDG